tara:strand:+ start:7257 stop:10535 length:3279 start_codon:yes stop_codon:yes gene_type:complete
MANKVAIEIKIKNIKQIKVLENQLKKLRKEQRELAKTNKEAKKLSGEEAKLYERKHKAITKSSKALREHKKSLANANKGTKAVTKSSNGMAKQFVKGAAAIGVIVGAFRMASRVISSVVATFSEFEFVMAKVNAVSGATEKEFAALTKTAEELGRTTFFTATQVGELMLNYSKLGFTANEIQDAVQPTLDLATATGSDLARAALVAGAAVRGFGLDASETNRVVDVMAVSFSSSAMNIEKWQTSMTKVAPIAKAAGFSIEDTAAIMSKLTDSGIEASIAGTSLRNILLKMQDPTSDLSKAFGGTIHSLDELVPVMKKFVAEGGSMADIMEVVDLRQAAAFEQMLTTADGTLALRDSLLEANGEGKRMADIVGDTLQGAFLKFSSALQGVSISVMEGFAQGIQGMVEKMASFFNVLAKNSKVIVGTIKVVATLVKWFGLYKLGVIGVNVVTAIGIKLKWTYLRALVAVKLGSQKLTIATLTLKRAYQGLISGTGIGMVLVVLSELVPWLMKTKDATAELMDETERITKGYYDSIVPIEKLKIQSKELIRLKGLMNNMVKEGLIVLDKEGKAVEGSALNLKVYNKYKGQAAIATRSLNTELKNNDQDLITEKTSIEGVATAIDTLTTALMNQALVKGFNRQIEALVEIQANAVVTKKRLEDYFNINLESTPFDNMSDAIAFQLSMMEKGMPGVANSMIPFEERMKSVNKILEDGGFTNFEQAITALEGKDDNIRIITEAFDELAGPGGIGGLILSQKLLEDLKVTPTSPEAIVEPKEKEFEALDSKFLAEEARGYWVTLMKDVLAGDMKMAAAEKDLYDYKIELMTNLLLDENLSYDAKMLLEEKLIQLKLGNAKKEAEIAEAKKVSDEAVAEAKKKQIQDEIEGVKEMGNQLILIAGEEENLQGIKKIGIQLSQAAAVAAGFEAMAKYSAAIADTALNSPWWLKIINVIGLIGAMASTYANMKALKKSFGSGGMIEEFADGGMVHGASHSNGGVKFAVGGRVNELEGGEAVINKRSTAMFRNQLSSMNQAGGGVKFADGGLLSSPSFTEAQFNANNQSQMLNAMGGKQKVVVVEADITTSQSTVSVIQANASF